MSEEELNKEALEKAKAAFINARVYNGAADIICDIRAAILVYLAAAPKPTPERVGITEEEAVKLRSFKSGSDACEFWQYIDSLTTPRPAPAKLTAYEIEREAISAGARAIGRQMAPTWWEEFKGGLDAYLAKKAELSSLDGSPRP